MRLQKACSAASEETPGRRRVHAGRVKRTGRLLVLACFGLGVLLRAHAEIYAFSNEDGAIVLSNFRHNAGFRTLVHEERESSPEPMAERIVHSPPGKREFQEAVLEVSRTYGLDSALMHAIIHVESRYRSDAVSKKGASGLMQLMPATAKRFGVLDVFDPRQNLHGGAQYFRYLLDLFQGDVPLALAAYNAGENAVIRAGRRVPPFRETMNYVNRVRAQYDRNRNGTAD